MVLAGFSSGPPGLVQAQVVLDINNTDFNEKDLCGHKGKISQ